MHAEVPPWIIGEWVRSACFCRGWRDQVACPRLHSWTMTEFLQVSRSSCFIQFGRFNPDQFPVIFITFGRLGDVDASEDLRIVSAAKQVGPQAHLEISQLCTSKYWTNQRWPNALESQENLLHFQKSHPNGALIHHSWTSSFHSVNLTLFLTLFPLHRRKVMVTDSLTILRSE